MRCRTCNSYSVYKEELCIDCYNKHYSKFCKKCECEYAVEKSELCHNCLLEYLNINEIFKDGFIDAFKNERIKALYDDYKILMRITIIFLAISVGLLGFAIITNDVDDFFILIILGSFVLTGFIFKKTIEHKKSIVEKEKTMLKNSLLSTQIINGIYGKSYIYEIIYFGEYAISNYEGDINKISDGDIAYLANNRKISLIHAKNYIEYYKRILNEFDNINKKIIYEQNCEEELSEYYNALEKYYELINENKYIEYSEKFDEIVTKLSDKLSANQYFEQMQLKKENIECLPYQNIKLTLKVEMPEIIILNKSTEIKGMIKANLYEKDTLVAEGYIHGNFENNKKHELICKKLRNIENIQNIEIKYELIILWLP